MGTKKQKTKKKPSDEILETKRKRLSFLVRMEPRKMVLYPLVVFLVAALILAVHFPEKGIDLKGGVVVTVYHVSASPDELASYVKEKTGIDVRAEEFKDPITGLSGIRIYAPAKTAPSKIADEISNAIRLKYKDADVTPRVVDPTFGKIAQKQGIKAVIYAFIGMAIVVFLFFRDPVPSGTIIFSAFSDMVIALATMGILGIELTTATIAALLMLIGYTVDSNILLTTRLLRRKEDTIEDAYLSAVSTGFTMSTTTLGALFILWLVSTSEVIDSITIVLIFGLLADFMNTWIFNAGVLRWYIASPLKFSIKLRRGK
ncbi:protein translocase subunit SecF [Thermococcus gammatolerans]|uniref:Protein-export membrane protein SecF n=1 Tax=Thermococcus gammatolerans (strain DSM 15229 / JCM 11827 / EJ3) TaxID=593117 RepID=SECF_THEGJ|nr:protein translocase subunit SecF [Thermococcus gammatolerans]C5A3H3.1 RecName: Full=Protein-export membrane protein SecF [Thermococcus gammatolerans EJ3]ACS32785.1 Protein export membrane protein, SecD/SecF family (secDF) [Thermococcus gammatolerans EJ3]